MAPTMNGRKIGCTALSAVIVALLSTGVASAQFVQQFVQQGGKLVGSGAVNNPAPAQQGTAVALSVDGRLAREHADVVLAAFGERL